MPNPVFHFEIPFTDTDCVVAFYEDVLSLKLVGRRVDGYDMAFFPRTDISPEASEALAVGDVYRP